MNIAPKRQLIFLATILTLQSVGCTTISKPETVASAGDQVVTQGGRQDPVISAHDRRFWLDLRQSKAVLPKMSGALATGEPAVTIELARAYLAKRPGDIDGLTMMATALAMSRNYDLAAYYAGLIEKARPGDALALNIRGMAAMLAPKARMADFRLAEGLFQQAFDADPSQIAAGLNLGALQLELGNAAGATATFGKVAKRCQQCSVGLMGYGVAASRAHRFELAKGAFESVLKKNPDHAAALYNLALVHKNGYHNHKKAENYLDQLLTNVRIKDPSTRERAQTVLRSLKAQAPVDERTMIADDADAVNDAKDAELLMTAGAEDNSAE